MGSGRAPAVAGFLVVGAVALTGCSIDMVIWGPEGARVIETTERLIADVSAEGTSELLCPGADVRLGAIAHWRDRSAGEPERFTGEFWPAGVPIPDAQWRINLERLPEGVVAGEAFPGDVFYREDGDGLCVAYVDWATLEGRG